MPDSQETQQPQPMTEAQRRTLIKVAAINEAMTEILKEQRTELVRRVAAKLRSIGFTITEAEVGLPDVKE